ncbi:hypothetical protein [Brevundimonas sp.]|uniref:hypothetical protein n=1 Tax=Brevundimonas sp. TaxID=1871086 RepID=UPI0028A721B8|nr:hypothetical protein [Brevundimonas sp.]
MTATQAPTPGPLDSESVKLLVKGDLLLLDGQPVWFLNLFMGGIRADNGSDERISALPSYRFAFIGRPDESGWIPWSGGENPVPGQRVSVRLRDGAETDPEPSNMVFWRHQSRSFDVVSFRLAPTAPVEARGSEREELDSAASAFIATSFGFSGPNDQNTPLQAAAREVGWMLSEVVDRIEWNKRGQAANALGRLATSIDGLVWPWEGDDPRHDQIRDAWRSYADNSADDDGRIDLTEVETCVAIGCMKAMQLLSPDLSPQPSGETREISVDDLAQEIRRVDGNHDLGAGALAEALMPFLSARPLALGGQQGEEEGCGDWPYCDAGAPNHCRHYTTPARAEAQDAEAKRSRADFLDSKCPDDEWAGLEAQVLRDEAAQDEGAAGEPVAWRWRNRPDGVWNYQEDRQRIENVEQQPLYAHPSPTPAADDDRVRIAVEALEASDQCIRDAVEVYSNGGSLVVMDLAISSLKNDAGKKVSKALAALKTTAAKEGGE